MVAGTEGARGGGHGQGSRGVQGQGQGQEQGHCNHGYRRGAGAMTDASPEARWSAERLCGDEGLVIDRGRRGITLSHARPNRGGGVLCQWRRTLSVAVAETKRGVGANCVEV